MHEVSRRAVFYNRDGSSDVFFDGIGKPFGPGHGHYHFARSGRLTFRREPSAPGVSGVVAAHAPEGAWERVRLDGRVSVYFQPCGPGRSHGHVIETRHAAGNRTYHYVRDPDGDVFVDDSSN